MELLEQVHTGGPVYNGSSIYGQIAGYAQGTNYVPQTGPAIVHQGEAIIPAGMNSGQGSANVNITLENKTGTQMKATHGPTTFNGTQYVKTIVLEAMDTDPSFRNAIRS